MAATCPGQVAPTLPTYKFVDLGAMIDPSVPSLAGKFTTARGLNDNRVVVGDNGLAFQYGASSNGIGWRQPTAGPGASVVSGGTAMAIDNSGLIAGAIHRPNGAVDIMLITTDGAYLMMPGSSPTRRGTPHAMSQNRYVVGEVENLTTGATQGFRWRDGTVTLIGPSTGYTQAFGTNDAGDVVGASIRSGQNDGTAFLWRNGAMTFLTPGFSRATDINNNGVIVGSIEQDGDAFRYAGGTLTRLGRLAGFSQHYANAINDNGLIVGDAQSGNRTTAVVWINGQPQNLTTLAAPPLGWELLTATAINANGDVAGAGTFGTQQRAFLLLAEPASPPADPARITNLSIFSSIAAPGDSFSLGYVVGGAGTLGAKTLVIRAVGPSLTRFNVSNALADPRLELYAARNKAGENDNWGGTSALVAGMAGVGAFAFSGPASRDAATFASVAKGDNSVRISAVGNGTGDVLAEVYDATPASNFTSTTPRLINVSVLKELGSGLTVGFVVAGSTAKQILIRAIGPALGAPPFNVGGVVADPHLELFSGAASIGASDDWGSPAGRGVGPDALPGTADDTPSPIDSSLLATFRQVGAFALPVGSKDAALVSTLPAGNYSVQVSAKAGSSGLSLVEIYEIQ